MTSVFGAMRTVLLLVLAACTPHPTAATRALLDHGYDSIALKGWAPECAPLRGQHFLARDATTGHEVAGRVCCDQRPSCEVILAW